MSGEYVRGGNVQGKCSTLDSFPRCGYRQTAGRVGGVYSGAGSRHGVHHRRRRHGLIGRSDRRRRGQVAVKTFMSSATDVAVAPALVTVDTYVALTVAAARWRQVGWLALLVVNGRPARRPTTRTTSG